MLKKSEMGIGTLIVFIAMIIVASITAGVLIQTASSLQNKALLTGERSKNQVSTNFLLAALYIEDGSSGNNIDQFYLTIKLNPGSNPTKLITMPLEFFLKNDSANMVYSSLKDCAQVNESNSTEFYVDYVKKGSNWVNGYVQKGDVIKICFESPRQVTEDESFGIMIMPDRGTPFIVENAVPDIITDKRLSIFP